MGMLKKLKDKISGKNVLYYPGCLTRYVLKQEAENYKKILVKMGIDFIVLPEENCCGSPVLNAGYEAEGIKLARKNLKLFKEHNIGKIITNCPACYRTFLNYKDMLPDWNMEVEFITKTILAYLKKKRVSCNLNQRIAYHDPCHLGRHSGIYEEPREILRLIGYEVVEMKNNRNESLCCGGGAGLKTNNPELANQVAGKRIEQAKAVGVDKIVTTCPLCFAHLEEAEASSMTSKSNSNTQGLKGLAENSNIEILEFSHVVADSLGLNPEKTNLKEENCELKEACS